MHSLPSVPLTTRHPYSPGYKNLISIQGASALIITIVSAILLGCSYYYQWGIASNMVFSCAAGMASLITLAVCCCKSKETTPVERRRSKLPHPSAPETLGTYEDVRESLYDFVKAGDVESFESALQFFKPDEISSLCYDNHTIMVSADDQNTDLQEEAKRKLGYSIFQIILHLKNEEAKNNYLRVLLKNTADQSLDDHPFELMFAVKDKELIENILKKLTPVCLENLIAEALQKEAHPPLEWILIFFNLYEQEPVFKQCWSMTRLVDLVVNASLAAELKLKLIEIIARSHGKSWETAVFKINKHVRKEVKARVACEFSLLHLAIEAEDADLVRLVVKHAPPAEKEASVLDLKLSALMHAVLIGNEEIVKILLEARHNPNYLTIVGGKIGHGVLFNECRKEAEQLTPLMVAYRLGRTKIASALFLHGAQPGIPDHPSASGAWTANDYLSAFRRL